MLSSICIQPPLPPRKCGKLLRTFIVLNPFNYQSGQEGGEYCPPSTFYPFPLHIIYIWLYARRLNNKSTRPLRNIYWFEVDWWIFIVFWFRVEIDIYISMDKNLSGSVSSVINRYKFYITDIYYILHCTAVSSFDNLQYCYGSYFSNEFKSHPIWLTLERKFHLKYTYRLSSSPSPALLIKKQKLAWCWPVEFKENISTIINVHDWDRSDISYVKAISPASSLQKLRRCYSNKLTEYEAHPSSPSQ